MRYFKKGKEYVSILVAGFFLWIPIQQLKLCRKSIFCPPREPQPQRWFITVTMSLWPETRRMPRFDDFLTFPRCNKKWMVSTCNYHTKGGSDSSFFLMFLKHAHIYMFYSFQYLIFVPITVSLPHGFPSLPSSFRVSHGKGCGAVGAQFLIGSGGNANLGSWGLEGFGLKGLPVKFMSPFWDGMETKHTLPKF